jgi:DNA repair ATPase RecN
MNQQTHNPLNIKTILIPDTSGDEFTVLVKLLNDFMMEHEIKTVKKALPKLAQEYNFKVMQVDAWHDKYSETLAQLSEKTLEVLALKKKLQSVEIFFQTFNPTTT